MGFEVDSRKGLGVGHPTLKQSNISTNPLCNILPHTPPPPPRDPSIRTQMTLPSTKFDVFLFDACKVISLSFNAF